MESRRHARQALAPSLRARAVVLALALSAFAAPGLASAHEEPEKSWLGCAGDGAPPGNGWPRRWLAVSGLVAGQGLLWTGRDLNVFLGDPIAGNGFQLAVARFGVCGRIRVPIGSISYDVIYEPWNELESMRLDAYPWGRFAFAEVGWQPLDWLGVYLGIRKVLWDFGADEPEQQREIPFLPAITASTAPDRRLGLTADVDFGQVRLVAGAYESARQLGDIGSGGVLIAARGVIEMIGPVGATLSTLDDAPYWRKRVRFGIDISFQYEWDPNGTGYAIGGDIPFKFGPLGFVTELLYSSSLPEQRPSFVPAPRATHLGLYSQLALMLWRPYLELEARYEWSSRPLVELPRDNFHAVTGGLSVYAWHSLIKLQFAVEHRFHTVGGYPDDNLGLLYLSLAY